MSTIGSPQGDGLSPILFAIYLEAAVRALHERCPPRSDVDANLPQNAIYADDTDFISLDCEYLDRVQLVVGPVFGAFDLIVNVDKTEHTVIGHSDLVHDQDAWRKTRKLGSLLGVEEDVSKRIVLANQAFKSLQTLWKNRDLVTERVRLMSYRSIVESVLLYNCATWALSKSLALRLDTAQRSMLRQVVGIKWSDKVSDAKLYTRCNVSCASAQVIDARWRMFGHTLRMQEGTPARKAMAYYFTLDKCGRQGNHLTIASVLSKEYEGVTGRKIGTLAEYDCVVRRAQDREAWKMLVSDVVCMYVNACAHEAERRHEKRHEARVLPKSKATV